MEIKIIQHLSNMDIMLEDWKTGYYSEKDFEEAFTFECVALLEEWLREKKKPFKLSEFSKEFFKGLYQTQICQKQNKN